MTKRKTNPQKVGRKAILPPDYRIITAKVSPQDHAAYMALGGSAWLRLAIAQARPLP